MSVVASFNAMLDILQEKIICNAFFARVTLIDPIGK